MNVRLNIVESTGNELSALAQTEKARPRVWPGTHKQKRNTEVSPGSS